MQSSNHGATAGLREHLERRGQLAAAPTGSQRTHIDAGEAALVRIEKADKQTFSDWLLVGHALCAKSLRRSAFDGKFRQIHRAIILTDGAETDQQIIDMAGEQGFKIAPSSAKRIGGISRQILELAKSTGKFASVGT